MTQEINTSAAILNGNARFTTDPHIFIPGSGTFYASLDDAKAHAFTPNGVGPWVRDVQFDGRTWYQCGYAFIRFWT